MLTLEMAIDKIRQLPPEKQEQVFQFVESLDHKGEESEDFFAIAGIWENREITAETLRQEAWKEQNK
ncbi:MAG: hypothetical protein RLZZ69_2031 [Cyanobacteriota bacterium]